MKPVDGPPSRVPARAPARLRAQVRQTLEGILDQRELYSALHRLTSSVMETDGFYIALYEPETDVATVVYWADQGEGREASITYPGSRSEVIRGGKSTLVEDQLESRSLMVLGDERRAATRSAASAPLRSAEGVVGAISAQSRRPRAYSREDLEALQAIADLAVVALRRIRSDGPGSEAGTRAEGTALDQALASLVGLSRVDEVLDRAVEGALALVPADGAVVWLLDGNTAWAAAVRGESAPEEDFSVPLVGEGARLLVEEREALVLPDLGGTDLLPAVLIEQVRAESVLAVPMSAEDRVPGVLSVGAGRMSAFTGGQALVLRRFADAAARALEGARQVAHLESLSLTDPLTGLPNRRHLEMHLAREFAAASRGRELSVVLLDVDDFRRYNDTLGRVAGDEVLRTLAEVLRAETRAMNLVARLEGDRFISILSDTDEDGARLHARRLEERIARHSGLGPHGITVSTGAASFTEEMESPRDLIRAADRDLRRTEPADAWE